MRYARHKNRGSCTCSVRIIGLDRSAAVNAPMTTLAMVPPSGLTGPGEARLCGRRAHLARGAPRSAGVPAAYRVDGGGHSGTPDRRTARHVHTRTSCRQAGAKPCSWAAATSHGRPGWGAPAPPRPPPAAPGRQPTRRRPRPAARAPRAGPDPAPPGRRGRSPPRRCRAMAARGGRGDGRARGASCTRPRHRRHRPERDSPG